METKRSECLKLGLRDEIDSVKETKIALSFQALHYETTGTRSRAPNPANRHDLPLSGQSFAPTNGARRPAGRSHQISQQSEQVIPRTDTSSPTTQLTARRTKRDASGLHGCVTIPFVVRWLRGAPLTSL